MPIIYALYNVRPTGGRPPGGRPRARLAGPAYRNQHKPIRSQSHYWTTWTVCFEHDDWIDTSEGPLKGGPAHGGPGPEPGP